ncbi:hypothetical protein BU17DRAFT_70469 [Hysterangium stoloniferum]|nr:hypothetical protein BU17DRAFT_70469 [Hysterangium stoloniferum]
MMLGGGVKDGEEMACRVEEEARVRACLKSGMLVTSMEMADKGMRVQDGMWAETAVPKGVRSRRYIRVGGPEGACVIRDGVGCCRNVDWTVTSRRNCVPVVIDPCMRTSLAVETDFGMDRGESQRRGRRNGFGANMGAPVMCVVAWQWGVSMVVVDMALVVGSTTLIVPEVQLACERGACSRSAQVVCFSLVIGKGNGVWTPWRWPNNDKERTRLTFLEPGQFRGIPLNLACVRIKGDLAAAIKCLHTFLGKTRNTLEPVGEEGMCGIDAEELEYGKGIIQRREKIIMYEVDKNGLPFDVTNFDGLVVYSVSASVSVSEGSDAVGLADVVVASVKGLTRRGCSPSWALLLASDRVSSGVDVDGDRGIVDIVVRGNGSERQWAVMPMDVVAAVVSGSGSGYGSGYDNGSGSGTYRCSGAVTVAVVVAVVVVAIGTYRCSGAVAVVVVAIAIMVAVIVREMVVQYGCFIGIIMERRCGWHNCVIGVISGTAAGHRCCGVGGTAMWYSWVIGDVGGTAMWYGFCYW